MTDNTNTHAQSNAKKCTGEWSLVKRREEDANRKQKRREEKNSLSVIKIHVDVRLFLPPSDF